MRITGVSIDGFGVWSGLALGELSAELNVFYGPNETGKTTLMQFVRSVLYGFSAERRGRYLPPVHGARAGGFVYAAAGANHYSIARHADDPDELGESPVVSDGQQTVAGEHALRPLLGEVDEPTFNNVFAIGLGEIQELGTLSDTQAADELYSLALGLDRVSLVDVLTELEASRNRLLAPNDRPSLVTQLLGERERVHGEVSELGQASSRYLSVSRERDKLAEEIARLEDEVARLDQQGRQLAIARAVGDRWQRRLAIDQSLASIGRVEGLPEDALAQFERLENRLASRRRRFERAGERRRALGEQIDELQINEPLCRQALRLEALGEQQQWIASLESGIVEIEAELLELESEQAESIERFGMASGGAADGALSKRALAELRDTAKSLRSRRDELGQLTARVAASEESAAEHARQLAAALGANQSRNLTQSLAEAGELVSQLRRRVQIDQRLDQMSRRETELEEQSQEHLESQMLPTGVLVGVGGLFVLGCALVLLYLAALVLPFSISESLGWPVGLVGVLAAAAAGVTKMTLEQSASRRLDSCHSQIHKLGEQIHQTEAERDELDARLPRGGGPLSVRLQTAEKALARLEELLPIEAERETAQREAETLRRQAESKSTEYRGLRKRWRELLAAGGLPPQLKPRELGEYARRRDELRALQASIDEKKRELARRRGEYELLSGRIAQLIQETGVAPRASRPLEQLRECLAELAQQQARLKRRDELARRSGRLARRQKRVKRQARVLRQRRHMLLSAAGAHDVPEFRRLAAAQAEAARLRAERVQLAAEIAAAVAGQTSEQQLAEWLATPQNLQQLETNLADARRIAAGHLNLTVERRGEMNHQLKAMLDDRRLANKRIELGIVDRRLHDALARWRVLATCGMMLEAVRAYYEREHQPAALREASAYFGRLTGGRYTRVWTRLGESALVVDDRQGRSLRVEVLSRGTREQLFLALRLALVKSYAGRGVELPLVLDDVLVNFDATRAKAAATVLRDFARAGHQLFVFTCHEHIAKLFKQLKAEVRHLPTDEQSPNAESKSPARPARRTRPEAPPIPEPGEPEEAEVAEIEPDIATSPAPSLPPLPHPEPYTPPRAQHPVHRVDWSAEEFEGELADRVRRPLRNKRHADETLDNLDQDDDAEAA